MNKIFSYPAAAAVAEPENPHEREIGYAGIRKHYFLRPSPNTRSDWYGSQTQHKTLKLIKGSFLVLLVQLNDWKNPKHNLAVQEYILCKENQRLEVPAGYVCSYKAIEPGSELGVFSSLTQNEEERFERELWYFDSFF